MDLSDTHALGACDHGHTVTIDIDLSGRHVTMRSCSACDRRWWSDDGGVIDLTAVLDITAEASGVVRR